MLPLATVRPAAGSLVGVGYHLLWVDRDLLYADPPGTIQPPQSIIGESPAFLGMLEHVSRAAAISKRYLFNPAPSMHCRKMGS